MLKKAFGDYMTLGFSEVSRLLIVSSSLVVSFSPFVEVLHLFCGVGFFQRTFCHHIEGVSF